MKKRGVSNHRFYNIYDFVNAGKHYRFVIYGRQLSSNNYVNFYIFSDEKKYNSIYDNKIKHGYIISEYIHNIQIEDSDMDSIKKINKLFMKVLMSFNQIPIELFIKYINQISTIKFVICEEKQALKKHQMEYMNEIYTNLKSFGHKQ